MPLVLPEFDLADDVTTQTEDWMNKLMGKKIGETDDATTFPKSKLPEQTRIIQPGQAMTEDYKENRLNVYLDEDGTVRQVELG